MDRQRERQCIAFAGSRRVASGSFLEVALAAKALIDQGDDSPILIFDAVTSEPVEIDFRGSPSDVRRRLSGTEEAGAGSVSEEAPRSPGRPKLGVIAREVTLLPRHWDWLNTQPGGASVTLRKLVENARRSSGDSDRLRQAREATYRFMYAMAGNETGFEEAARALFGGNQQGFNAAVESWPPDVRDHARRLSIDAF